MSPPPPSTPRGIVGPITPPPTHPRASAPTSAIVPSTAQAKYAQAAPASALRLLHAVTPPTPSPVRAPVHSSPVSTMSGSVGMKREHADVDMSGEDEDEIVHCARRPKIFKTASPVVYTVPDSDDEDEHSSTNTACRVRELSHISYDLRADAPPRTHRYQRAESEFDSFASEQDTPLRSLSPFFEGYVPPPMPMPMPAPTPTYPTEPCRACGCSCAIPGAAKGGAGSHSLSPQVLGNILALMLGAGTQSAHASGRRAPQWSLQQCLSAMGGRNISWPEIAELVGAKGGEHDRVRAAAKGFQETLPGKKRNGRM